MKEKIIDILEKHYHGRNFIESRCADELLGLFNVVGSKPTAFEKNNLPLEVRYAFCEAIEMYHNIQAYEMGLINKKDFINDTIAIKDKYR